MSSDTQDGTVGKIAKQTFGRINTTVAITIATYMSSFLSMSMPRDDMLVLVSVGVFVLIIVLKNTRGILGTALRAIITAKSVMGIVATTTIMRSISDIGRAGTHAATVLLGTCFVLGMGILPDKFRTTHEGRAIYMGTQYAYADIALAAVTDRAVRAVVAVLFLASCTPSIHDRMRAVRGMHDNSNKEMGPIGSILSALSVAGVSFVMDTVMPASVGSIGEDVVRGLAALLLVHALLGSLNGDVESFAMWTIARRFSGIMQEYGFLEMAVSLAVVMGILSSFKALIQGETTRVLQDLVVLTAVFLMAGWTLDKVQTGNTGDTVIALISVMCVVKSALGVWGG